MKFLFKSYAFNIAVIGILLGVGLMWRIGMPEENENGARIPAVNPYNNTIAASGIVESLDRNIEIGAPVSGMITKVYVQVADEVKKGNPLFEIDPRELEAELILEEADVFVAKATLQRLEDQLKRLREVPDQRAISQDLLETRENDVKVSMAQLLAKRAKVRQTRRMIERLTVRAPIDGVILQDNIRVGEYYSTGSSKPALRLGNIKNLQVRVDVDEQNASRFRPGYPAVAFPKNNPTVEIPLVFFRIEPYVIPKQSLTGASNERVDTRVLQVIYSFQEPKDYKIFVGQQVDVFIHETE